MSHGALLHGQPDARSEGRAVFQTADGRRDDDHGSRADQDFPAARHQGIAPYLHDGRLLTLEDTVEFFNLILQLDLAAQEKKDLVAFLRVL